MLKGERHGGRNGSRVERREERRRFRWGASIYLPGILRRATHALALALGRYSSPRKTAFFLPLPARVHHPRVNSTHRNNLPSRRATVIFFAAAPRGGDGSHMGRLAAARSRRCRTWLASARAVGRARQMAGIHPLAG